MFLESVLMLELFMQILIIPSVLQLMILLMNLRCRHDITMILRHLCMLSTKSSLKRTPTLVWVASHQNHYNTYWLRILNINALLVLSLGTSVRTFGFPFITNKNVSIILLPFTPQFYNEGYSDICHGKHLLSSFASSASSNHTINAWNNFR